MTEIVKLFLLLFLLQFTHHSFSSLLWMQACLSVDWTCVDEKLQQLKSDVFKHSSARRLNNGCSLLNPPPNLPERPLFHANSFPHADFRKLMVTPNSPSVPSTRKTSLTPQADGNPFLCDSKIPFLFCFK